MSVLVAEDLTAAGSTAGVAVAAAAGPLGGLVRVGAQVHVTVGTTTVIAVDLQEGIDDAGTVRWSTIGTQVVATAGSWQVDGVRGAQYRLTVTTVGTGNTLRCLIYV